MPILTLRLEHDVYNMLRLRAAGANLSLSAFLRPVVEDAAFPGGKYVYTTQDELLGIAIQTFTIVAELAAAQSPSLLDQANASARDMLRERGLIAGDHEAFVDVNPPRLTMKGGAL